MPPPVPSDSEMLPTISATAAMSISRASVQRARGRIEPRMLGAGATAPAPWPASCRPGSGAFEPEANLADRDLVPEAER